jgi:hypothetical protein
VVGAFFSILFSSVFSPGHFISLDIFCENMQNKPIVCRIEVWLTCLLFLMAKAWNIIGVVSVKGKRIYSVILIMCLIVSSACFDNFRAGTSVRSFGAPNESHPIFTESYCLSGEDVCTEDMLGNTFSNLIHIQTVTKSRETKEKAENLFLLLYALILLQCPFYFLVSANPNLKREGSDFAQIIHFIHNKDGKKKI